MSAKKTSQKSNKVLQQEQINQITIWLNEGLSREEILQKAAESYNLKTRTIDKRLNKAREQSESIMEEAKQNVQKRLQAKVESSQERIVQAHLDFQEFLAGIASDISNTAKEQLNSQNPRPFLTTLKTMSKSGLYLKDLQNSLRLEAELPNSYQKQELTGKNGEAIEVLDKTKVYSKLSSEELKALAAMQAKLTTDND
jgi:hypothetical protein